MTILRQKMEEDLQLRGLARATQESYLRAVRQLAEYHGRSPDQLTEDDIRAYFLYLKNEKKAARGSVTIALCGIKFFYEKTLKRKWGAFDLIRPAKSKKLPVVLSQEEVKRILGEIHRQDYRTCLTTIYSCGLRLQEGLRLEVNQIDSERMMLHIRKGKGGKDRYVPLPENTCQLLRQYWVTHRHPKWLFPGRKRLCETTGQDKTKPMNERGMQTALKKAVAEQGIQKAVSVHTLRHSYATHLLEEGVNLRQIQTYLGHNSLQTTTIYTHLTRNGEARAATTINRLMDGLGHAQQVTPW
ncbi:MAG: site-specific integrase [Pseudomonadota bacterium]